MIRVRTPDDYREAAAKGRATRRANIEAKAKRREDAITYAGGLKEQIEELEQKLIGLKRADVLASNMPMLTSSVFLREEEIVSQSLPYARQSGVYFLISGNRVVYVGQSVDVYTRIAQHQGKEFDRYAVIMCAIDDLDKVESLYIHCLRPPLNGNQCGDTKCAPIPLNRLFQQITRRT